MAEFSSTRLPVALADARERVILRLTDAFARDELDLETFEERLNSAHRAGAPAELERLIADLPAPAGADGAPVSQALVLAPKPALAPASGVRERQRLWAIMGGVERKGPWRPPRQLKIITAMGGVALDFRAAQLAAGTTEVVVFALMGGVEIIVPPWLAVTVEGAAIAGGFEHVDRAPEAPDAGAPLLHVRGVVVFGGVSVETRLPGESARDARRRSRRERKALAAARDKALGSEDR
jgi:hypothetical protein